MIILLIKDVANLHTGYSLLCKKSGLYCSLILLQAFKLNCLHSVVLVPSQFILPVNWQKKILNVFKTRRERKGIELVNSKNE